MFKTIAENATAKIVEKKSKFIANIFYVENVEEAEEKIRAIKKKYFDARHNCFAYSIFSENGIINRFSDDGEPSGTAGAPLLNIINSKQLNNILVIVTRYFGGILLGTGGLVRAYTSAFQEALKNTNEIIKEVGMQVLLKIAYQDLEKAKYYLKQNNIEISDIQYNENIQLYINLNKMQYETLLDKTNELNFKILDKNIIINEKYIQKK